MFPAKPVILMILTLTLISCGISPKQNRYQMIPGSSKAKTDAVTELQNRALYALSQRNAQQAIEYLERAIKIEPRDAMNWHYLAKSYHQQNNTEKCLAMIERSMSYGRDNDDIIEANQTLNRKCLAD